MYLLLLKSSEKKENLFAAKCQILLQVNKPRNNMLKISKGNQGKKKNKGNRESILEQIVNKYSFHNY